MNLERRAVAVGSTDRGSHQTQGRDDASHRTPCQRFVAMQITGKVLSGQDSRKHTHGRTGVTAVQTLLWRAQLNLTVDLKGAVRAFPHLASKLLYACHGACAVCSG